MRTWAWSAVAALVAASVPAASAAGAALSSLEDAPRLPPDSGWRPPADPGGAGERHGLAPSSSPAFAPRLALAPVLMAREPRPTPRLRRGPVEERDEWILAQPRLTMPPLSPDPVGCGRWRVRLAAHRGNDFGWTQTSTGELPAGGDRRFLVDGEHQTTEASVRYGVSPTLDVAVRLPVHWRGAGFMDGPIDVFHEALAWAGVKDNKRPDFDNDRYRVEGRSAAGVPFSWSDDDGAGLGNVELAGHWAFAGAQPCARWTWAAVGRVTLPTATGVYAVGGVDLGAQLVTAARLAADWDLYLGAGGTWFSEPEIDGVRYEQLRGSGFAALEWHPAPTWSLIVTLQASSNLITNIALYPAFQSYLDLAVKLDVSRCWQVELGLTENLADQQSTSDFGVYVGLVGSF